MAIDYAELKAGNRQVAQALADARSARHLTSRRKREETSAERADEGARRRRKAMSDREAEAFLSRRLHIKMPEGDRPRTRSRTPRKLFTRTVEQMLRGTVGATNARSPDGRHSIHFAFTPRGFASKTGRRWRAGEAERAALYSVREEALEGGELGWWSNVADDRNELVAHYRASEAIEAHDRANANVYLVEVIALPAELTAEQRRQAVKRICRQLERLGLAYTVGIHLPDAAGDQRNFHLHLVYSMRRCRRVAPYEWVFATAKRTEINTPHGIMQRRCAVVVAINETLREAGVDKRYTPLSNRDRGMAQPVRAKVGQQATWAARRLAAADDRHASLLILQDQLRQVRTGLVDAAKWLGSAGAIVRRRCLGMAIKLSDAEAIMPSPAALKAKMHDHFERQMSVADEATRSARAKLMPARSAVSQRLTSMRRDLGATMGASELANRREILRTHLAGMRSHTVQTVADIATWAAAIPQHPIAIEHDTGRTVGGDRTSSTDGESFVAPAPPPNATIGEMQAARHRAALRRQREIYDEALAMLRRKRCRVWLDADGRYDIDDADLPTRERGVWQRLKSTVEAQSDLADLHTAQQQSVRMRVVDMDAVEGATGVSALPSATAPLGPTIPEAESASPPDDLLPTITGTEQRGVFAQAGSIDTEQMRSRPKGGDKDQTPAIPQKHEHER